MATSTQILKPNPTKRTEGLSAKKQRAILKWISSGKTAKAWLTKHNIPHKRMYNDLHNNSTFRQAYVHARKDQAESMSDEILEIVNNVDEDPASRRVRADSYKWIMSRVDSERWGDKIELVTEHRISLIDHLKDTINVTPAIEDEGE